MGKVLVVDDNPEMLERLQRIVQRVDAELEVIGVKSLAEASVVIDREPLILIAIIDVFLKEPKNYRAPEGLMLVDRLRATHPNCYSILLSSQLMDLGELKNCDLDLTKQSEFVSALYANRDWRSQLEQAITRGRLRSIEPVSG